MGVAERFALKISPEPNTGCWLWLGGVCNNGYGRAWDGERLRIAHRLAWEFAFGVEPRELDHKCSTRSCVNVAHLEEVTHQENQIRASARRQRRQLVSPRVAA